MMWCVVVVDIFFYDIKIWCRQEKIKKYKIRKIKIK